MSTCPQVDQYMRKEVSFDKSPRSDWPVVMPGWCQVLNLLTWKSWALSVPFSVASFNKKQHTQKMAKLGPSFSQTHPRGMPHPAAVQLVCVVICRGQLQDALDILDIPMCVYWGMPHLGN